MSSSLGNLMDFVAEKKKEKKESIDFDYFDWELLWQLVNNYLKSLN